MKHLKVKHLEDEKCDRVMCECSDHYEDEPRKNILTDIARERLEDLRSCGATITEISQPKQDWIERFDKLMLVTKANCWLECSDYEETVNETKSFIKSLKEEWKKELVEEIDNLVIYDDQSPKFIRDEIIDLINK